MLDIAIGKPYCFLLCIFRVAASSNLPFSLHINRGNDGTGASSTCNGINQGGSWCNVGQTNCEEGCQGKWCTNDGNPTPTPPPSPPLTPPPVGSNSGIATTTRYPEVSMYLTWSIFCHFPFHILISFQCIANSSASRA